MVIEGERGSFLYAFLLTILKENIQRRISRDIEFGNRSSSKLFKKIFV